VGLLANLLEFLHREEDADAEGSGGQAGQQAVVIAAAPAQPPPAPVEGDAGDQGHVDLGVGDQGRLAWPGIREAGLSACRSSMEENSGEIRGKATRRTGRPRPSGGAGQGGLGS